MHQYLMVDKTGQSIGLFPIARDALTLRDFKLCEAWNDARPEFAPHAWAQVGDRSSAPAPRLGASPGLFEAADEIRRLSRHIAHEFGLNVLRVSLRGAYEIAKPEARPVAPAISAARTPINATRAAAVSQ